MKKDKNKIKIKASKLKLKPNPVVLLAFPLQIAMMIMLIMTNVIEVFGEEYISFGSEKLMAVIVNSIAGCSEEDSEVIGTIIILVALFCMLIHALLFIAAGVENKHAGLLIVPLIVNAAVTAAIIYTTVFVYYGVPYINEYGTITTSGYALGAVSIITCVFTLWSIVSITCSRIKGKREAKKVAGEYESINVLPEI